MELNKYEQIAAMAMQGILSDQKQMGGVEKAAKEEGINSDEALVIISCTYARALCKELGIDTNG